MKKIILIFALVSNLMLFAQEEPSKVIDESFIKTCSVCGLPFSINEKSECDGRSLNKYGKPKKPKGTHIYVVASMAPPQINPNPVLNECQIYLPQVLSEAGFQMDAFSVYDLNGNLMMQENMMPCQSYLADFTDLPPGNYILNVQLDEVINNSSIIATQFVKL